MAGVQIWGFIWQVFIGGNKCIEVYDQKLHETWGSHVCEDVDVSLLGCNVVWAYR
jgi:hypothetical protein